MQSFLNCCYIYVIMMFITKLIHVWYHIWLILWIKLKVHGSSTIFIQNSDMSFKRGNWDPKWFAQGHTGRKQQSQIIKLDLPNSKAHTVFTLPSWPDFKSLDFSRPQNPPLTSSSWFLYFHYSVSFELFLGFPSLW